MADVGHLAARGSVHCPAPLCPGFRFCCVQFLSLYPGCRQEKTFGSGIRCCRCEHGSLSRFVALQPLESRVHPACAQSWLLRAPLSHRCEHVYVWCARDRAMATSRRQRCSCQCCTPRSLNRGWWLPPRHRQLHCCRLLPPRRRLHHIQRHRRRVWCRHRAVGSRPPRTSKVRVWMCECVSLGPTARATQTQCLLLSCRKCK